MDERVNTSDREDIHIFSRATNNAFYGENKWILRDLLEKSVKAKHGYYPILNIQLEILRNILAADSAHRTYVRWKDLVNRAIRGLLRNGASRERVKYAQERLRYMNDCATGAELFLDQLRSIGDGIAWWFLDYDRANLRLLAEHSYVPAPLPGTGLTTELGKLKELAIQGRPCLLNSITNFLRVGDVTVYDKSGNTVELIEVKAGKKQTLRTVRQGKHLALVQDGLRKGTHPLSSGGTATKISCSKPLLTYANVLEHVLDEAKRNFASSRVFGEYLSLCAFHTGELINLPEEDTNRIREDMLNRSKSIFKHKGDVELPLMSGNILPAVHFSRILAPYTIFPIPIQQRLALMTGEFTVFIRLNISGLKRWLQNRGWKTQYISPPDNIVRRSKCTDVPVLRIFRANSPLGVEIGLTNLIVAAMELWMPESIERTVTAVLDHRIRHSNYIVNFPNVGKCAWD